MLAIKNTQDKVCFDQSRLQIEDRRLEPDLRLRLERIREQHWILYA